MQDKQLMRVAHARGALREDVRLVAGASRAALYDFRTGNVYSINEAGLQTVMGARDDPAFWDRLIQLDLAKAQSTRQREGTSPNDVVPPQAPDSTLTTLDFVWFEIASNLCNARCLHCYADSKPQIGDRGEPTPIKERGNAHMRHGDWLRLIAEAYSLGCRRCQFIGGEPLLYRGGDGQTVLDLAETAKEAGYEFVEIFTNATLLTPEIALRIRQLGLEVAVSLYSCLPAVHDSVTQLPGSHSRTMRALLTLQELGIPTRIAVILMRANESTIEETREWLHCRGFGWCKVDVVRPTGRAGNLKILPTENALRRYGLFVEPDFYASKDRVAQYSRENSCLARKVAINDMGDVMPCIFGRDWQVGNVLSSALEDIVHSPRMLELWSFTKDRVLVCQDCEYRYLCRDCRPLAYATTGRLDAPSPRCTYNPYIGQWGLGTWTIDDHGQAIYVTCGDAQGEN